MPKNPTTLSEIDYELKYLPNDSDFNNIVNDLAREFMEIIINDISPIMDEATFIRLKIVGEVHAPDSLDNVLLKDIIKNIVITKNVVLGSISDESKSLFYRHIGLVN